MANGFDDIDFKALIAKETNARMRIRLLAIAHVKEGASRTQTAKYLKVSRGSVNKWVSLFLAHGIDGLREKVRSGRPTKLTEQQIEQFKQYVLKQSHKVDGGRLMAQDFSDYIYEQFSVKYSIWNIYRLLHALNFSWISSRSRHPKQSDEVQDAFKKLPTGNDP